MKKLVIFPAWTTWKWLRTRRRRTSNARFPRATCGLKHYWSQGKCCHKQFFYKVKNIDISSQLLWTDGAIKEPARQYYTFNNGTDNEYIKQTPNAAQPIGHIEGQNRFRHLSPVQFEVHMLSIKIQGLHWVHQYQAGQEHPSQVGQEKLQRPVPNRLQEARLEYFVKGYWTMNKCYICF